MDGESHGGVEGCAHNGAPAVPDDIPLISQGHVAQRGFFYVGGRYIGDVGDRRMVGQMYVEVYVPREIRRPYPLVLIHGAAQTGLCWMMTPDGRSGWADYFLKQGYVVYVVDQPARGRSPWQPGVQGDKIIYSAEETASFFTTGDGVTPQMELHTQWPGSGEMGDAVFDALYASQIDSLVSTAETQHLMRSAGAALLDKIGPAAIIAHSQAGQFGWFMADDRPDLVRGIVAIEPSGPPFVSAQTGELILDDEGNPASFGISLEPLTFDPPLERPAEFSLVCQIADEPDLIDGCLQAEPARKLPHLADIPVLVLTAEASYHAPFDHWTVAFLRQAGVEADFLALENAGIHGNGHLMMLEKNNLEIAALLDRWLCAHLK